MKYTATSANTKKMLAESLKKLLQKKSFSAVTVKELTEDCGLNRNTFYYHFEDINDLLKWTLDQEAIDVMKNFDLVVDYKDAIEFAIEYIGENERILTNLYHSVGNHELRRFFYNDFHQIIASLIDEVERDLDLSVPADFKDFLCRFYTEALAGMIVERLEHPESLDKEKIFSYLIPVVQAALPHTLKEFH